MPSPISAVIFAAAFYQLKSNDTLNFLVEGFFALPIESQISLLAILFSIVYFSVDLSDFIGPPLPPSQDDHDKPLPPGISPSYPLQSLSKSSSDRESFMIMYPYLRDNILQGISATNPIASESVEWIEQMIDYTVPGGKLNRGLTVISVQRTIISDRHGRDLTSSEVARASVLGWALEYLQAFFLVADDVMDESETRRGQPCWYKKKEVGIIAVNDSFLLESFVYTLLKQHFGSHEYYQQLVDLFLDVSQKTELGQLLDLTSQPLTGDINLDLFTMERYKMIVKYKTAFYTFYLPVAIGMVTAGIKDDECFELARSICVKMGEYFQIQDDYLDCFGDPEVIGKVGTDIQDKKCSWLVVQALSRATPEQHTILKENYGVWDDAKVSKVKKVYQEMDLPKVFSNYEEEFYLQIKKELDKITLVPRDVFESLLKKIYKRSK